MCAQSNALYAIPYTKLQACTFRSFILNFLQYADTWISYCRNKIQSTFKIINININNLKYLPYIEVREILIIKVSPQKYFTISYHSPSFGILSHSNSYDPEKHTNVMQNESTYTYLRPKKTRLRQHKKREMNKVPELVEGLYIA